MNIRDENNSGEVTLLVLVPAADLGDFAGQNVKILVCECYRSFGISQINVRLYVKTSQIQHLKQLAVWDEKGQNDTVPKSGIGG